MKENLIKSKKRVKDFAEVYTPNWLVKDMVALTDAAKPSTTILEPACGNGNFLAEILEQKLSRCYSPSDVQMSVGSLYGIDIQDDNVRECRQRLCDIVCKHFPDSDREVLMNVLDKNIVCGNFLTKRHWAEGKETNERIWFLEDEQ